MPWATAACSRPPNSSSWPGWVLRAGGPTRENPRRRAAESAPTRPRHGLDPDDWLDLKALAAFVGAETARAVLVRSQHRDRRGKPIVQAADAADILALLKRG